MNPSIIAGVQALRCKQAAKELADAADRYNKIRLLPRRTKQSQLAEMRLQGLLNQYSSMACEDVIGKAADEIVSGPPVREGLDFPDRGGEIFVQPLRPATRGGYKSPFPGIY